MFRLTLVVAAIALLAANLDIVPLPTAAGKPTQLVAGPARDRQGHVRGRHGPARPRGGQVERPVGGRDRHGGGPVPTDITPYVTGAPVYDLLAVAALLGEDLGVVVETRPAYPGFHVLRPDDKGAPGALLRKPDRLVDRTRSRVEAPARLTRRPATPPARTPPPRRGHTRTTPRRT
jgi:hypothetical protein